MIASSLPFRAFFIFWVLSPILLSSCVTDPVQIKKIKEENHKKAMQEYVKKQKAEELEHNNETLPPYAKDLFRGIVIPPFNLNI